jgi:AAA15 family ATPase/GTPase
MHLSRLRIQNFRSIENIDVEFDGLINVIVGPNAIGKTTVLESIRLTKALLPPRTQGEAIQTMISLGHPLLTFLKGSFRTE